MGGEEPPTDPEGDIVQTAINIIRSEAVLTIKDRIFGFFREKASTAFTKVTRSDDKQVERYNLDVLEDPEQEVKIVAKGPETPPFQTVKMDDGMLVELNLDAFSEEGRETIISKVESTFEEQGRLLTHEQELEFEVVEEADHNERNREILRHFNQYLSEPQLKLLRRSLSLRTAWEMDEVYISSQKVGRWKRDLANKFGDAAFTVTNFCSSGYYDEGGILRKMIEEVATEVEYEDEIHQVYDQIVSDEPFVVYVGHDDDAWGRSVAIRNKLKKSETYPYSVPFVDLRAQGKNNIEVAKEAIDILRDDLSNLTFEELHSEKEVVYRIDAPLSEGTSG